VKHKNRIDHSGRAEKKRNQGSWLPKTLLQIGAKGMVQEIHNRFTHSTACAAWFPKGQSLEKGGVVPLPRRLGSIVLQSRIPMKLIIRPSPMLLLPFVYCL
jgi:hypothetical protein